MDQFLTLEKAKIGPVFNSTVYIYIYIYIRPPPPRFLAKRHFSEEGDGGVYFEVPRSRNVICPPFIHPPSLEGYFQGWGGGVYNLAPYVGREAQCYCCALEGE